METPTTAITLADKVAAFKVIARDSLRMNLIVPRLSRIANIEASIKDVEEDIADETHTIKVHTYEISKMDVDHPDYAEDKAEIEECVKNHEGRVVKLQEVIVALNKEITDQKEGIAKIESGETKVSLDSLNDLVSDMIKKAALNQVK